MTPEQAMHADRALHAVIDDLAEARTPDYLEAAIERASSRPQRPAWTFLGRWLPLDLTTQAAPAARLPWRPVAALALIALLIAAAAAVYVGSRTRLPAPYGPAANGLVAYARGSDIVVADPETGEERVVVGGADADLAPRFSRDGSRIVFERLAPAPEPGSHVMVVAPDGSGLTALTSEPLELAHSTTTAPYTFAPDGKTVAIAATRPDGGPGVLLAQADGSASRWLDISGLDASLTVIREPAFRPDGAQLLLTADPAAGQGGPIIFTVDTASGQVIDTVVRAGADASLDSARWSPDGRSISYTTWSNAEGGLSVRTHIVAPDGTGDRLLPAPDGMVFDIGAAWSNDGSKMFVVRGYTNDWPGTRPAIVPTDGSGVGVEIPYDGTFQGGCCYAWEWSPDDSMILGMPITPSGVPGPQAIVDVEAARITAAPWAASDHPAWQRVAP